MGLDTIDFKEAYEAEKRKNAELTARLSEANMQIEDLDKKLKRIKNNPFWKMTKPFRVVIHAMIRTKDRLKRLGSLRGLKIKLKQKRAEKKARYLHGKASFPNAARRQQEENTKFSKDITISILVPLYNTPKDFLIEMIDSVRAQTYAGWELCLADGSDEEHAYVGGICKDYISKDDRIRYTKLEKNEGISGNTNACYKMATGNYIGLFDHDDLLHPSALYEYMKAICDEDADYIYCDELTFEGKNVDNMVTLHFKPDFAIDNLRANNYICHFSVFSRELLEGTELFRSKFNGSQDHDMILRLTANAKNIVHVPRILYYWRSHKASVASGIEAKPYAIEAAKGAVSDHLEKAGFKDFSVESTRAYATIFRVRYALTATPKISIIIPNKDHEDDLRRAVDSILNETTYENFEIIIVENNSTTPGILSYYKELENEPKVKVVTYKGEFNYSAINNFGVSYATGEYILLLNNDTKVITPNFMEEMLMYAQREDVACVGAKLYYEDDTIQHAGVIIGMGAHRSAGHGHYRVSKENLGYMGRLCYAQNVSAVTGACLMVSKEIYDRLSGLDEGFAVALNDVDFCLRARELGYLNVFTPFAELYHFESKSRGLDEAPAKAERYQKECDAFRARYKSLLEKGDPYFNPNFSLDSSSFELKY